MRRGSCWSAAMLAVLAAGCALYPPDYIPVIPPPRQLQVRGAAEVATFLVTPPARAHLDIGMVRAYSYATTVEQLVVRLRMTAGRHGCDALVITSINLEPRGLSTAGWIEGSCEIFTDPPAPTPSPS
jgi:hypothetical protein